MKRIIFLIVVAALLSGCEKEGESFITKYKTIPGVWELKTVAYDSLGYTVTGTSSYNILAINDNLEYRVYMNKSILAETGTVEIIRQTNDYLELYFNARNPLYSSFAGSHIFGVSNCILVELTCNEMILKSVENGVIPATQYWFVPQDSLFDF